MDPNALNNTDAQRAAILGGDGGPQTVSIDPKLARAFAARGGLNRAAVRHGGPRLKPTGGGDPTGTPAPIFGQSQTGNPVRDAIINALHGHID